MEFDVFGASDIGCVRSLNEDSFYIYGFNEDMQGGFCILSDGMGGHNAGEVASGKTVEFVSEVLKKRLEENAEILPPKLLSEAVTEANLKVYELAQSDIKQSGMGATLVAVYIVGNEVYTANVGDSRAYLYSDGELLQITKDHSVVEEMVASGSITREEARNHPQKNIITRAVGTDINTEADLFERECNSGDCLLLCSDGLSGMLEDEEICNIIQKYAESKTIAEKLIEEAKARGGYDNITVVCVRFKQEV